MEEHLKLTKQIKEADLIIAKNSSGDTLRVFKDNENLYGHMDPSFAQLELVDEKGFVSEILLITWKDNDPLTNPYGQPHWSLRVAEKEDLF